MRKIQNKKNQSSNPLKHFMHKVRKVYNKIDRDKRIGKGEGRVHVVK